MKKNIYKILIFSVASLLFGACATDEMELNKGYDTLTLSLSDSTDSLKQANADATAATFKWTTGNNANTGAAISYVFEIAKKGTNFASGIYENLGKQVYSRTFTAQQLSQALVTELGCTPGVEVELEARVTAKVSDASVAAQQSTISFKVTPFLPVTETLFLIGDATPNGWSADKATAMTAVSGVTGSFKWTGELQKGKFKFITTLGSFLPSYNKATDNTLVYRSADGDPDEQFSIDKIGTYSITVSLTDLTITIDKIETNDPPFSNIYFVGSFTSWSFVPMTQDPVNPFIFRYGVVLSWVADGEFKFGTTSGSWDNMYHPTIAKAPYTHTSVTLDGTNDNKWVMLQSECGKAYKIALNITPDKETMTMTPFTPYAGLWLVGDATPNGWSIDKGTAMSPGDDIYTFTWTGNLTTGEVKITCDKQGDWMGAWFMSSENDKELAPVTDEVITFVDKSIAGNGDIDRKWKVKTAGNYTITLNQLTEKMTVVKNY